ncbi:hypothetical protein [Gloeothece citriformis]|nr:hypothetical protein [Gloeothece citriformis]
MIWSSLATAVVLSGCVIVSWAFASNKADDWGRNVKYYPELKTEVQSSNQQIDIYLDAFENATDASKQRIKEQLETLKNRAITHLRVTKDLYIWSAISSTSATLASVITAMSLLHITRQGWDKANPAIWGVFVVSFSSFILSTSFIVLYQYQNNISVNAKLYTAYINLEENILCRLATKLYDEPSSANLQSEPANSGVTLEALIHRNQKIIQEYSLISYEIAVDNIPSLDKIQNTLNLSN